jgi:hypothetical protein
VLFIGAFFGPVMCLLAQEAQQPSAEHPYKPLTPRLETSLRYVTDFSFPGGPTLQVKVYDWVIGPRQELPNFPLEGFATIEVKAGEIETTMDGATIVRHEGERWVVPEGTKLSISIKPETGRGDNIVSLRGVVVIRK